jgi:2-polyprenyl-6-methoxyphenol hydroxylase-like FAD-dependent oxidoreductase
MQKDQEQSGQQLHADAIIIGGGLAGLATAIHLTRGGLKVVCLEPRTTFAKIVGESLDWSAPLLFEQLGLPMQELVETGAATYKKHITITATDGEQEEFLPGPWLAERPWNVELRTLHLDRQQIHTLLQQTASRLGITTLHERATGFKVSNGSITAVETSSGHSLHPRWVVDASGAAASVLGREFKLKASSYGPRKIALWAHLQTEQWVEGTTLYTLCDGNQYMEWMWEIPIRPGVSSIGYVAPGATAKAERGSGLSNVDLLRKQMQRFPRLKAMIAQDGTEDVGATSYLCRTYKTVCGPSWVIVGEAASQSDPITGNGVTAALRHAAEGSALICTHHQRNTIPWLARSVYNRRVHGMGCYFNSLIEKLYYQPALRLRLGIFTTARVYTVPAWLTNVVYSRTRPTGPLGTLLLCSAMLLLRAAAWSLFRICSLLTHQSGQSGTSLSADLGHEETEHAGRERSHVLHPQR